MHQSRILHGLFSLATNQLLPTHFLQIYIWKQRLLFHFYPLLRVDERLNHLGAPGKRSIMESAHPFLRTKEAHNRMDTNTTNTAHERTSSNIENPLRLHNAPAPHRVQGVPVCLAAEEQGDHLWPLGDHGKMKRCALTPLLQHVASM
jgi:hypothetical protein